jgi:hypothetical protein
MIFTPQIEGSVPIGAARQAFFEAFQRRVAAGLLTGRPQPRSNYAVVEAGSGRLSVHAADWSTATNVGLNELELEIRQEGLVHFRVRYWRWAVYGFALAAAIGVMLLAALAFLDVRSYLSRHPSSMLPGLSLGQNVALAWLMAVFWGFVWPWLMIPMHKKPLRGLVARLIADVDANAQASADGH